MTKTLFEHRHFVWLAEFCKQTSVPYPNVRDLARALESTNPRFDWSRFMTAAGHGDKLASPNANWRDAPHSPA